MDDELFRSWKAAAVAAVKWEKAAHAWERVARLRGYAAIGAIVVAFACAIGWAVSP